MRQLSVWRRYIISNEVVPITRFNVIGIVLCVRPEQKVYPTQNKIYCSRREKITTTRQSENTNNRQTKMTNNAQFFLLV